MSFPSEQTNKGTAFVATGTGTQNTDAIKILKKNIDQNWFSNMRQGL